MYRTAKCGVLETGMTFEHETVSDRIGAEVTSGADCSRGGYRPLETHGNRLWTTVYQSRPGHIRFACTSDH